MPDNLADIKQSFECKEDARFAGGYAYFCHHCGLECNVGEVSFDCQGGNIFPIYIKCRYGCGKSWHLRVFPTGSTSIQRGVMARYTSWPRSGKTGNCAMMGSKNVTLEALTIRVRMTKETMELFSIPIPARQQEFPCADHTKVRVLDNPLEENLRKYVAWGRL